MEPTKEQLERAENMRPEIKAVLAKAPIGQPFTLSFALWHVKQIEMLESRIENIQREHFEGTQPYG